ncbi:MAG: hypothetical protein AAF446_00860 [Pseudomonadota bacterium]
MGGVVEQVTVPTADTTGGSVASEFKPPVLPLSSMICTGVRGQAATFCSLNRLSVLPLINQ